MHGVVATSPHLAELAALRSENQALRQQVELVEQERDDLRAQLNEVDTVAFASDWESTARLATIATARLAEKMGRRVGDRRRLDLSNERIGEILGRGLGGDTLKPIYDQLGCIGVKREKPGHKLKDDQGREVDKKWAGKADELGLQWETIPKPLFLPDRIEYIPSQLHDSPLALRTRTASREKAKRFKELEAIVRNLPCPNPDCGRTGTLHLHISAECSECHTKVSEEKLNELLLTVPGAQLTQEQSDQIDAALCTMTAAMEEIAQAPSESFGKVSDAAPTPEPEPDFPKVSEAYSVSETFGNATQLSTEVLLSITDARVSTGLDTLQKLYEDGMQFCRVYHRHATVTADGKPVRHPGKQPFGDGPGGSGWQKPCGVEIAAEHLATGQGNVGMLGTMAEPLLDPDRDFPGFLAYSERHGHRMTKLFIRPNDTTRGKCRVRITDPKNLRKRKAKEKLADGSIVFETLYAGYQGIVAGVHTSGATIEMIDLGEIPVMTAAEFDALVDGWLYERWHIGPLAVVESPTSALSAQASQCGESSTVSGDVQQHIFKWIDTHGAKVLADLGNPEVGDYISLRADDDTPSALVTMHEGRIVVRDYGSDEWLDLFDIHLQRKGIEKRVAIGRLMNGKPTEGVVKGARAVPA